MNRRHMLAGACALIASPAFASKVRHSEAEWRAILGENSFQVMRKAATERRFTSPLNDETRDGVYHCRGCNTALYRSGDKFDSGTGWPSFTRAIRGVTDTQPDRTLFGVQTEVHCDTCDGHLGHIFDDGPAPTGKRHCINGLSLTFRPA